MQTALETLGVQNDMDLAARVLDALCSMQGKYVEATQIRAIVHSQAFPVRTGDVKAVLSQLPELVNARSTERNTFYSCTYAILSAAALEKLAEQLDRLTAGMGVDGRRADLHEQLAARMCKDQSGRARFALLTERIREIEHRMALVSELGNT